jgi:hypothetical protein
VAARNKIGRLGAFLDESPANQLLVGSLLA